MTAARRVGLLFGGRSVEHEVSVVSARGVAEALAEGGFDCVPIGVTGEGRWLSPEHSQRILSSDAARVEGAVGSADVRIAIDPGGGDLVRVSAAGAAEPLGLDVVFPLVHGWGGEDGRLQGGLELAGIPYVGSGVAGSAAAMDKVVAKQLFAAHGLPITPWLALRRDEYRAAPGRAHARAIEQLGLPLFVKPANGGSSVGVSRVRAPGEIGAAFDAAFDCDHHVLVETAVDAREIECAVLGNDSPQASGLGEIVPSREFYDYVAKYLDGSSRLLIPAPLDAATAESVRGLALAGYRALGLAGFARMDFLVDRKSLRVFLNEANTLPGFTPISMFPKLWQAEGVGFPDLCGKLIDLALERSGADRGLRTRWKDD